MGLLTHVSDATLAWLSSSTGSPVHSLCNSQLTSEPHHLSHLLPLLLPALLLLRRAKMAEVTSVSVLAANLVQEGARLALTCPVGRRSCQRQTCAPEELACRCVFKPNNLVIRRRCLDWCKEALQVQNRGPGDRLHANGRGASALGEAVDGRRLLALSVGSAATATAAAGLGQGNLRRPRTHRCSDEGCRMHGALRCVRAQLRCIGGRQMNVQRHV
mmetsp:Transcript_113192/g.283355  ORF Transcript_113192/g.283355 Transcript_113192/m.283355 type:complete len:216 (+) Transcript_113192:199-846(+)